MANKVTLGGDRLGSGKKMQVELDQFKRSNFDRSYAWRSSASPGTLIPFMVELGLPGDTIDIELQGSVLTHPTLGPLFGSFKVQYDVFQVPIRLYNSWLHNNKLEVGRNMAQVLLPVVGLSTGLNANTTNFKGHEQINPSCIMSYLGIRGVGRSDDDTENRIRTFNGVPYLAYWEIYKNYYANKQEEVGAVIHGQDLFNPINYVSIDGGGETYLGMYPAIDSPIRTSIDNENFYISFAPSWEFNLNEIYFNIPEEGGFINLSFFANIVDLNQGLGLCLIELEVDHGILIENWEYSSTNPNTPRVVNFALSNIDDMREQLLASAGNTTFEVNGFGIEPYSWIDETYDTDKYFKQLSQEGLGVKTYQSDMFNNWLNESWISQIATQSAVSVISGSFTIDELVLKKKVWEMLNNIAVADGSYEGWVSATYDEKPYYKAESPVYIGGMSQELEFQQVISTAGVQAENQPLGSLAGRGNVNYGKNKGGKLVVKCREHCYIMGIVSLTPRIDYSQGNSYDVNLTNMDEFHKPHLDGIGFQDLITDQMAWFDTEVGASLAVTYKSAGKQPAWMNYQTNYNKCYGNFAIETNEMFMTLNRRYEGDNTGIVDLTTYIDPAKFNFIFADTRTDAQNFWVQIGVNMEYRRKMSSRIMPYL